MILAAALFLGAALIGWHAPRLLQRLTLTAPPGAAISAWLASITGVLLSVVAGVVLLVLPGHGPADAITAILHDCWSTLSHAGLPQLDPIAGLSAVVVLSAVAGNVGRVARRRRRHRERIRGQHEAALRILRPAHAGSYPTLWLAHDEPMAYSLDGPPALVVATNGLANRLSDQEIQAVLAHEHAHLRGKHHRLVGLASTAGNALGFIPLMREAPAALRLLVELAADRAAVAECGIAPVRSALLAMTSAPPPPPPALAMAGSDTPIRLRQLNRPATRCPRLRSLTTGVVAALTPAISSALLLLAGSLIWCP
ncbi:M56 family metallopeptidase [Saccharothrix sp. AJ9571]|nr:M56 family metallopeptidase [Saccharothrix sp. AJ9571]